MAPARRHRHYLGVQFPCCGLELECGARADLRQRHHLETVGENPLTALATHAIFERALKRFAQAPQGLSGLLIGGRDVGEALVDHPKVPLVSATGSTAMGRIVGQKLAGRFARAILELGGNNAAIVTPSADLDLALRGVAFAAMGTAGQRCTTLRRLFVHRSIHAVFVARLKAAYESVSVGNPLDGHLVGPLIDEASFERMQSALNAAREAGGIVHGGTRVTVDGCEGGIYVRPALVEMPGQAGPVLEETFAPILYVMTYDALDDAIALQNDVSQGLSSAIFSNDLREAERFVSHEGSDCGIANVNIGTSGAEIGGAFGGEKETGGGRESGSDAWKGYMRRATNTINYGRSLPLAQGSASTSAEGPAGAGSRMARGPAPADSGTLRFDDPQSDMTIGHIDDQYRVEKRGISQNTVDSVSPILKRIRNIRPGISDLTAQRSCADEKFSLRHVTPKNDLVREVVRPHAVACRSQTVLARHGAPVR